ncbi:MAG TPA: GNAT family N-acetyltransferase [Caldilineaceae bacterium]|nr:GNAT family N-acetyltransferase [Caldilineaceae bacterium]
MVKITTRPVTAANWREALALDIYAEQREFTPSVAVSLAKAYIQPDGAVYDPIAVYAKGKMVGFYSFIYYPGELQFCSIGGFLIDRACQRQGYGRAALVDFLTTVQHKYPTCSDVFLTIHPRNQAARNLYQSLNFVHTGDVIDGEEVMRRTMDSSTSFWSARE